jgi:hypothetical protein
MTQNREQNWVHDLNFQATARLGLDYMCKAQGCCLIWEVPRAHECVGQCLVYQADQHTVTHRKKDIDEGVKLGEYELLLVVMLDGAGWICT